MDISLFFELAKIFNDNNYTLYLVGGSVRDYLLYKHFDDMDVVTSTPLKELENILTFKSIFSHCGSGKIIFHNQEIDITNLRCESNYDDFRHPKEIKYVESPKDEYQRRDITINALYMDKDGKILDFVNGQKDLENKIIRCVGNAEERFKEDPLRILRVLRFAFNLSFEIEENTRLSIFSCKHLLKKINYLKICEELRKFKNKEDAVRDYLSKYKIDEEIPLFYECNNRIIFDLHCDTITALYKNKGNIVKNDLQIDFNKMQKGSYLGQVFAVFVNLKEHKKPYQYAKDVINYYHKLIKENNNFIEEAYTYEDLIRIEKQNKRIAFLSIEDAGIIEGDLSRIDELYSLGVRMMTLTWNYPNCIGNPNINLAKEDVNIFYYEKELGLTPFGKKVVKKMNDLGMIIDVSHLSDKGLEDVLSLSKKPICASHSSIRELNKCARNLDLEQLKKLHTHSSIIGINYCYDFVKIASLNYIDSIVEHFKYIKNEVNSSILCFGSDFDGIEVKDELKDASTNKEILSKLTKIFSKKELSKIAYENFFNLVKENQN